MTKLTKPKILVVLILLESHAIFLSITDRLLSTGEGDLLLIDTIW